MVPYSGESPGTKLEETTVTGDNGNDALTTKVVGPGALAVNGCEPAKETVDHAMEVDNNYDFAVEATEKPTDQGSTRHIYPRRGD